MANNLKRLNNLIEFLKVPIPVSPDNKSLSLKKIENLAQELKRKRQEFLIKKLKDLKQKIKKNYNKLRIPSFSLIEYDWNENSHSNILEYLINYNSFEAGGKLLSELVAYCSISNKGDLCKKILKTTYSVDREYKISVGTLSGRIDLFILDKKEKFVIIIENKILAEIGETLDENKKSIPITQLEKYEKWCEESYPDYIRLYILLNFSNSDNTSLFEKTSYKHLYDNLKDLEFTDNISEDYLLLLNSILNPLTYNLSEIKKLANKIINVETPETSKISLTDYYTLKTIFYAK